MREMEIILWVGLVGFLAVLIFATGPFVYAKFLQGPPGDTPYVIHENTMMWDGGEWRRVCAVIAPTWEAYDQLQGDFKTCKEPPCPCPVILWPRDEPLPPGGMRNFKPGR